MSNVVNSLTIGNILYVLSMTGIALLMCIVGVLLGCLIFILSVEGVRKVVVGKLRNKSADAESRLASATTRKKSPDEQLIKELRPVIREYKCVKGMSDFAFVRYLYTKEFECEQ